MIRYFLSFLLCAAIGSPAEAVLDRLDESAKGFRSMTAKVKRTSHTAVIDDDTVDTGTIAVKRVKAGELRLLSEITEPDAKAVALDGKKLYMYFPKIQTVQEIDIGKSRGVAEQFFLVGFASTKAELETDFQVKIAGGQETVGGVKATRIELTPKSADMLKHVKKVELWVPENAGYPVQQKFHQQGGDYNLVLYSDVKINPDLPDSALKMKLPKNVKREVIKK